MNLHILCTSCLTPNTSISVAISEFNQRLEQTKASLLKLRSLSKSPDITIFICDISSHQATLRLYYYCIAHLPPWIKIKPLLLFINARNVELCTSLGKGYSEYLMLQCYYDHLSTLHPKSCPDFIVKVGARSLPTNLHQLLSLLTIFRAQRFFAYSDNRFSICETRCFALKPSVLGSFLNSSHIKHLNDANHFYIEHALYAFAKDSLLSTYPIPFIPFYTSLISGSCGTLINENIYFKALKYLFFGQIK